jgi:hypothetical protein
VSTVNTVVAFYDIHSKEKVLSFSVSDSKKKSPEKLNNNTQEKLSKIGTSFCTCGILMRDFSVLITYSHHSLRREYCDVYYGNVNRPHCNEVDSNHGFFALV